LKHDDDEEGITGMVGEASEDWWGKPSEYWWPKHLSTGGVMGEAGRGGPRREVFSMLSLALQALPLSLRARPEGESES
jgi:hypothetical protein